MRESRLPGLSIGLIKNGELVYSRGFGFRDIERGLPATPGTIYGIGSITKSFTALAILKLAEEGRLSLQDQVEKYIPLRLRALNEPVLVHHLLTHSSGIPALGYAEAFINGVLNLDSSWLPLSTPNDVFTFMSHASEWAVAKPGERFFYLNEGYVILGEIIRKVSGMPYDEYVARHILKPLGMGRTYFKADDVSKDPDVAVPYIVDEEGRRLASRFPFGITSDGGLLSNVIDMSRYVAMLVNGGELNGVRVISREYLELAERKYIDVPWRVIGDEGYGYGLVVSDNFMGERLISHGGNVLVYTAYMAYMPARGVGVVVMANAQGYPLANVGMYALALMLNHDPDKEIGVFIRENTARLLEGVYESYGGAVRVKVSRRGDFLILESTTKHTREATILVPEEVRHDYARYFTLVNGVKTPAEFHITNNGVELIYERFKLVKGR
jgi:CubicO group peptidase (beta-lactamase class C family)